MGKRVINTSETPNLQCLLRSPWGLAKPQTSTFKHREPATICLGFCLEKQNKGAWLVGEGRECCVLFWGCVPVRQEREQRDRERTGGKEREWDGLAWARRTSGFVWGVTVWVWAAAELGAQLVLQISIREVWVRGQVQPAESRTARTQPLPYPDPAQPSISVHHPLRQSAPWDPREPGWSRCGPCATTSAVVRKLASLTE